MAHSVATREHAITVAAERDRLMPLFTAAGERLWANGWDPVMLSGDVEPGSVFVTGGHGPHAPHGPATTWIVTDFEPAAGRVRYARLADGSNMGLVEVRCVAAGASASQIRVRYTLTPLSMEGERFVLAFLEPAQYASFIDGWKAPIERALGLPSAQRQAALRSGRAASTASRAAMTGSRASA